jgi:hypothetical protein
MALPTNSGPQDEGLLILDAANRGIGYPEKNGSSNRRKRASAFLALAGHKGVFPGPCCQEDGAFEKLVKLEFRSPSRSSATNSDRDQAVGSPTTIELRSLNVLRRGSLDETCINFVINCRKQRLTFGTPAPA